MSGSYNRDMMITQPFGKTGFEVSCLGFGAAPAAYLKAGEVSLLNQLLDAGMNLIDTAASYPGSEEFIGQHFSHRRQDFILVSKCGDDKSLPGAPWSEQQVLASVDRSLQRLKTDAVDVMLLHTCDFQTLKKGEALGALVKARNAGKIRFAGYSGDNEAATWAAQHGDVAVIETSINIVDQVNIDGVLPVARRNNIGIIAKRPVANACWKDLDQQPGMYKNYAKDYTQRLAEMKLTPGDRGFSGDPATAWPELALRFALSQPGMHVAIVGTTNPINAQRNLEYAAKGPLSTEVVQKIREAFRQANANGDWKGLT